MNTHNIFPTSTIAVTIIAIILIATMGLTKELESYGLSLISWISYYNPMVVRARDTKNDKLVAIKLFDLSSKSNRQFMIIEIDIMSRLKHPHIIGLTNIISQYNGGLVSYIGVVMSLGSCILSDLDIEHYDADRCLSIFYKLAKGLAYLHSQRILHLDIKHDNIIMKDDEPYWIDFGSSSLVDDIEEGIEQESELISLLHRPPEIYNGCRCYAATADVWSFGILMLLWLTGNSVFHHITSVTLSYKWLCDKFGTNQYIIDEISKVSKFSNMHKSRITSVITSMLQINPHKRNMMKQVCDHIAFDSVRIPVNGTLSPITYSKVFNVQHRMIMREFVTWTFDNYDSKSQAIFLTIDLYYRVAGVYATDTTLTLVVLEALFIIACKLLEEDIPDALILNSFFPATCDMSELEVQLIHKLDGVIYHSPYYEASNDTDELAVVLRDIILQPDPLLYTTLNVSEWFTNLRSKSSIMFANKNIRTTH